MRARVHAAALSACMLTGTRRYMHDVDLARTHPRAKAHMHTHTPAHRAQTQTDTQPPHDTYALTAHALRSGVVAPACTVAFLVGREDHGARCAHGVGFDAGRTSGRVAPAAIACDAL